MLWLQSQPGLRGLGCGTITADEAQQLKTGQWYIEVSSQEFPNGELRGQLDNILFCSGFEESGC
jgi:hypothetical protein